ncbi:MAG: hypothetical protein H6613_13980 [Ignavibacteriales bacterium]|nr:hypothetical protein [Ignavibacteriales bacterium]
MKKIIFILFLTKIAFAQNLDSLYNELLVQHSKIKSTSQTQIQNTETNKCGFGLTASVKAHFNEFSYEQQQTIEEILDRPTLQTSIVSPSGFFRIHYDTTGQNAPTYNINDLAIACDSAYTFEVTILGYPAPPKDGTSGGTTNMTFMFLI